MSKIIKLILACLVGLTLYTYADRIETEAVRFNGEVTFNNNVDNTKESVFIARVTTTNSYTGGQTSTVICSTIVHQDGGSYYNTTNGAWTPPKGLIEIGAMFKCQTSILQNKFVKLFLYQNDVIFSDLWDYTTAANGETPLMNPIFFFYNDTATNAYTIRFFPQDNNQFYGQPRGARWWGRVVKPDFN